MIENLFKNLISMRKERQRPAHKADENQFGPAYMEYQRELITKAYQDDTGESSKHSGIK